VLVASLSAGWAQTKIANPHTQQTLQSPNRTSLLQNNLPHMHSPIHAYVLPAPAPTAAADDAAASALQAGL
jgi:hypothetical protein